MFLCRMVLKFCGSVQKICSKLNRLLKNGESCFVFCTASLKGRSAKDHLKTSFVNFVFVRKLSNASVCLVLNLCIPTVDFV